ncbi:MAG: hypothetical protein LBF27_15905 [Sphingobacterium sp.]|nr:hypothetical protein [Sphingobacterium sp.]
MITDRNHGIPLGGQVLRSYWSKAVFSRVGVERDGRLQTILPDFNPAVLFYNEVYG